MGAILVMYHYVRDPDPRHPGIAAITLDDFEGQVEHLLRHYEPLEPDSLLAAARDGSADPGRLRAHVRRRRARPLRQRRARARAARDPRDLRADRAALPARPDPLRPEEPVRARAARRGRGCGRVRRRRRGGRPRGRRPGDHGVRADRRLPSRLGEIPAVQVRVEPADPARGLGADHGHVSSRSTSRPTKPGSSASCTCRRTRSWSCAARGHSIAGHSIGHPSLPQLDESEQEREIAGAADWLGGLLGEPLAWFNYPYGDHDERSERVCERLGLSIAYSTRPPADWAAHEERFRVPRVDTCFLPVTGEAEPAVLAGEIV